MRVCPYAKIVLSRRELSVYGCLVSLLASWHTAVRVWRPPCCSAGRRWVICRMQPRYTSPCRDTTVMRTHSTLPVRIVMCGAFPIKYCNYYNWFGHCANMGRESWMCTCAAHECRPSTVHCRVRPWLWCTHTVNFCGPWQNVSYRIHLKPPPGHLVAAACWCQTSNDV